MSGGIGVLAAIILAAIIALNIHDYFRSRDGQWRVTLTRRRMRRFVDGRWQYRPMKDDEIEDETKAQIW